MLPILRFAIAVSLLFLPALLTGGCRPLPVSSDAEWVRHTNPVGFSVTMPRGSDVETGKDVQVVVHLPERDAFLLVQPFLNPSTASPAASGERLLSRLDRLFPNLRIASNNSETGGSSDSTDQTAPARFAFTFSERGKEFRGIALCAVEGPTGILYAIAGPAESFASDANLLRRIAGTFQFEPSRLPTPPPQTPFTTYTEPNEGMFVLEVPEGWTVSGGLVRRSPLDSRYGVRAVAPPTGAQVVLGDTTLPPYAVLTEEGQEFGLQSGSRFDAGLGTPLTLRPYVSGLDFAREYVRTRLTRSFLDVVFTETSELATESETVAAADSPVTGKVSIGAVRFAATRDGRPWRGYCLAGTRLTRLATAPGGIWTVDQLYAYLCPASEENEAQRTLYRMVESLRLEENWLNRNPSLPPSFADRFSEQQDEVRETLQQAFASVFATDSVSRMYWGMTEYRDPATGTPYRFVPGTNRYWQSSSADAPPVPLSALAP
ncbi:MAG: hypothetical protein OHK0029_28680 [Armatimonadaceae bacterium]